MNLVRMSVFNATIFLLKIFAESGYHSLNDLLSSLTVTVYLVVVLILFFFPLDVHSPGLASIDLDLEEFSVSKDLQVRLSFYNNRDSRQWASYATCGSVMTR